MCLRCEIGCEIAEGMDPEKKGRKMRKEELIVGEKYKYKRVTRDEKTKEQVVKQKIMKLVAKHKYFAVFDTGVGKKTCLSYWETNKRLSRA